MSDEPTQAGRGVLLRAVRRAPRRATRPEFLIPVAMMAIERWDRLAPADQERFRELAARGADAPAERLSAKEWKELRSLWKRVEAHTLLREAAALLGARGA